MPFSAIGPIEIHLPERVEDNDYLAAEFPRWDMPLIYKKTGIRKRHIAAPDETAADLGVAAAQRLFDRHAIDPKSIDFLLFCTQSPDYLLPTTACLIQDRLGLKKSAGALDFNLGCSGFVYGLALADGLIQAGSARRVLLLTAETYSKYIDPTDRSLRTIFGDGAAATLVEASEERSIRSFVFGTDGSGADTLMLTEGVSRKTGLLEPKKRKRWPSTLYMDGPELVKFTLDVVPPMIEKILAETHWDRDDVDYYLVHQATAFMLEHLRNKLSLERELVPEALEEYGNTVSSTIPILIYQMRQRQQLKPGKQTLLIGFGVGLSWAGCAWTETWTASAAAAADEAQPDSQAA